MLVCLVGIFALLLTGCGGTANNPTGGGNTDETQGNQEPITITIGLPQHLSVQDYDSNKYTEWLEEVSGYNIEFVLFPTGEKDYKAKLTTSVLVPDEKLPDILWSFNLNDDTINDYGEQGCFIDLSEYFNDREKSGVWWDRLEEVLTEAEQDKVWRMLHSDSRDSATGETVIDGKIYCFPSLETSLIDTMDFMPLINQNWLKNLNLKMPETLDELVTVLEAFRDQDANGDGDPTNEEPMIGAKNGLGSCTIEWLINFFIYHDDTNHFNVDANGKLYLPYTQEKYKEALLFIRDLIKRDLLNVNTLTYGTGSMKKLLETGDQVGVTVIHPTLGFSADKESIMKWSALDLYGNVYYNPNNFKRNVFITEDCANPDAAWNLLMIMSSKESAARLRYGEKGVDWDWADEGATSIIGLPATIKLYNVVWGTTTNQCWLRASGSVVQYSENEGNQLTGQESPALLHKYEIFKDLHENYQAALAKVDQSQVCPWLRFSEAEDAMAPNRESLKDDVVSWRAKFLNGDKDIKADWQEYLNALETAQIQAYLDAGQKCYDRMYKSGN